MKRNTDFMLRDIAGEVILVPTGAATQQFNGMITLNEVAAFIWKNLDESKSKEELVDKIMDEFEVEEGKEVSMMISGSSMNPFLIHQRDYILMKKPEEELKAGDMVFFQRRDEAYVMHRIHHINKEGKLFIIGDAQVDMEGPIDKEQVFAIITKVKRKGKWIAPGDFWWEFFEHIWLHLIPFRRFLMKLYGIRR